MQEKHDYFLVQLTLTHCFSCQGSSFFLVNQKTGGVFVTA